jgi:hypothetical protein
MIKYFKLLSKQEEKKIHGRCLPVLHSKVFPHGCLAGKTLQAFQDKRLEAETSMDIHPTKNISNFLVTSQGPWKAYRFNSLVISKSK